MARLFQYTVGTGDVPATLGGFLRRQGYSEALLASLRQTDGLRVDGAFRRMIDALAPGERVSVTLPREQASLAPNLGLRVPVLYEDADILVLNKPTDMLAHPAGLGFDDAAGNFAAACWPDEIFRPIGRLDRHTSGALLLARHQLAGALLTAGPVEKTYLAAAEGQLPEEEGRIDLPLGRRNGPVITYGPEPGGKPSSTLYRVLAYGEGLSLLSLKLLTGRTHQIRAHLAALGHPLAGDSLYGGAQDLIQRQALHCWEIRFPDLSGETQRVFAPLPPDMQQLLAYFSLPENLFTDRG